MKDLWHKLVEGFTLDHGIVTLVSLISTFLASARNEAGTPFIPRFLNGASGFFFASLSGYALLESGLPPWLSSGIAYVLGIIGSRLMNAVLVMAKMLELDPLTFTGKVIDLIWSWKLPTKR